jgi:hypothetical protein
MIKVADFIEQHKQGKVSGATLIKMAAFRAELEKTAIGTNFLDSLKGIARTPVGQNIKNMAIIGGSMGIGSLIFEAVRAAEKSWTSYKLEATKQPRFDAMLDLHPELKEKEDLAARYFDALWHFSPTLAQEPMSAGAYIKQALQMHHVAQGPLPEMVGRITEVQKNIRAASPQAEYSTPMGAAFLSLRPQAGGAYKGVSGRESKGDPNQMSLGL